MIVAIVCGYIYVAIGATWPPVADEYVTRWDYRLAFFAASFFPLLLVVLVVILLIEWRFLPKED